MPSNISAIFMRNPWDAGEFLSLLWCDPWEVTEWPLPDDLDLNGLHQVRMIVYAVLQVLDLTLDESTPLIGRLVEIDRRIARMHPEK